MIITSPSISLPLSLSLYSSFLKFVCFSISGTSLSIVIRSLLFKSLLRQEIGWYDKEENATSALLTKLTVDAGLVQGVSLCLLLLSAEVNASFFVFVFCRFLSSLGCWYSHRVIAGVSHGSLVFSGNSFWVLLVNSFGDPWIHAHPYLRCYFTLRCCNWQH